MDVARDMYVQSVQAEFAVRTGMGAASATCRVTGKFRGEQDTLGRAEAALNRALELNPDLSMADRVYAENRSRLRSGATRDRANSSDAHHHAAATPSCSPHSCACAGTAVCSRHRLPRTNGHGVWIANVRTSVQYTLFMAGDFLRAAAHEPGGYAACGGMALAIAGHPDAIGSAGRRARHSTSPR